MSVCIYTSLQQGVIWDEEEISKEEIFIGRPGWHAKGRKSLWEIPSTRDGQDVWAAMPIVE